MLNRIEEPSTLRIDKIGFLEGRDTHITTQSLLEHI